MRFAKFAKKKFLLLPLAKFKTKPKTQMKNISKSLLAVAVIASAFVASCKKGEEDPTISLRSRKSRVAGEWKVASSEVTTTNSGTSGNQPYTSTNTEKFDGTNYSASNSWTQGSTTSSSTTTGTIATNTYTFEKDGTWKSSQDYTTTETETDVWGDKTVTTTHYVYTTSGVWNFLGKIQDDTKNKEEMSVSTLSRNNNVTETTVYTPNGSTTSTETKDADNNTFTYAVNEVVEIWRILELKNKEMEVTMTGEGTTSISNSSTQSNTTVTSTSSTTHKSMGKMILTQE
jgi:hypothetical protein